MDRLTQALGRSPQPADDDPIAEMSPVDLLRLRRALAEKEVVSPEQAAENRRATGWEALSMVPGPGNVIAAKDAYDSGREAVNAFGEGRLGAGALNTGAAGLSAFGAVTGLPFGKLARAVAKSAPDTAYAIPAWHGSPHDFDEFKLDKIGTGEGAQAYGHGLYFAENPAVAKDYQTKLSSRELLYGGKSIGQPYDPGVGNVGSREIDDLIRSGELPPSADYVLQDVARLGGIDEALADYKLWNKKDRAEILEKIKDKLEVRNQSGRLYHTELDVEPEDLLDWDKPLGQQGDVGKKALAAFEEMGFTSRPERTLAEIKQIANEKYGGGSFNDAQVSQALRGAGIPGIKYLDQGSRSSGEGSRNFVIFDDKLVKVFSKE